MAVPAVMWTWPTVSTPEGQGSLPDANHAAGMDDSVIAAKVQRDPRSQEAARGLLAVAGQELAVMSRI